MSNKNYPVYPGWTTVREIGRGSFGGVYEIQRDVFGKTEKAALKLISIPENESDIEELRTEGYDDNSITAHFKGYLEDVVREYSVMLDLKGHSNVVYCDDLRYIQHEDGIGWNIYIKMELLTPLKQYLKNQYSESDTVKLGIDLCNALILCRQKNIIHRDIKPENIFVSETGDYKLGDFGIAKVTDKTASGTKVGTFEYMAPEVFNNQPYSFTSDIYAVGLVMYWMMNGKRAPFLPLNRIPTTGEKENARKRRFDGEALPSPAYGSESLCSIVLKACAFNPKERYVTAEEMLRDLKLIESGLMSRDNDEKTVGVWNGSKPEFSSNIVKEEQNTEVDQELFYRKEVVFENDSEKTVGMFSTPVQVAEDDSMQIDVLNESECDIPRVVEPETLPQDPLKPDEHEQSTTKRKVTMLIASAIAVILLLAVIMVPRLSQSAGGSSIQKTCESYIADGLYLEAIRYLESEIAAGNEEESLPGLLTQYENMFIDVTLAEAETISTNENRLSAINYLSEMNNIYPHDRFQTSLNNYKIQMHNSTIAAGGGSAAVVRADGSVEASGEDACGQVREARYLSDVSYISAGDRNFVCLTNSGDVIVVGDTSHNFYGADGWTNIDSISVAEDSVLALTKDGKLKFTGKDYGQKNIEQLYGSERIVGIAAGWQHNVVLYADGTVKAIGNNKYGQTNVEYWTDIVAIAAGTYHTLGLKSDGTVVAAGGNGAKNRGQCDVDDWYDIVAISAGDLHSFGIRNNGSVVATGWNDDGQCKVGNLSNIVEAAGGYKFSILRKSDGSVVVVGNGNGDYIDPNRLNS